MTTEIISSSVKNGQRIVTQRVIYDKSDDLFALANYQRSCEQLTEKLVAAKTEDEKSAYQTSLNRARENLAAQQIIVDSYGETE